MQKTMRLTDTHFLDNFYDIFLATVSDVLPIILFLVFFQVFVLRKKLMNPAKVIVGFCFVLIGIALFIMGLEQGLFPLGKIFATSLTDIDFISQGNEIITWANYYWVYIFAFLIGFATTIAEPSLIIVALKAQEISAGTISAFGLRIAVAVGVAIGISLGCFRIVTGTPLYFYITTAYILVIIQSYFTPKQIVPLAFDSGGVTTSTVTVPLVAALGLGLSSSVDGRSPLLDGFGLIAFAGPFPILSVMVYAQISAWNTTKKLTK